ncbi:amino acid adenylation [Alteromonas sp. ASW11-130]|uniref:amino acid adenylation n=1 Tax=Alteromonas sp. ASW11-130 TaxID=3015775 RepID=UPI002242BD8A|nr:amino acid adenylation [Alteromonas sp. ASW11-130]MCW8091562.1 amino acid adenylation [Alteromonas sp. ASW11-130]
MKLQLASTNSLNKWLKAELPRLPTRQGKQAGVNTLKSDSTTMCWQAHIIDNQYKSYEKTIIACEANSRFIFFIPVTARLTLDELTKLLIMEWQAMLAETLESYQLIPRSEIVMLLSELSDLTFNVKWVKNTDLSINGHISDAGLWVEQILREQGASELSAQQATELAIYLNTSLKRITNKETKRKEKVIPVEKLLAYCRTLVLGDGAETNVVSFEDYRNK